MNKALSRQIQTSFASLQVKKNTPTTLEDVVSFVYSGGVVDSQGCYEQDINARNSRAKTAFRLMTSILRA